MTAQTVVFVSVARLEPVKNGQILLEAFSFVVTEYPQVRLVFIGDGAERGRLQAEAERRGIADKVVFTGFRKDVARLLSAADVFVLASVNEGMGRAVLEAMAVGIPVIVSRAGGLPSIVKDGQEGFLVAAMDVPAWRDAMGRMMSSSTRAHMGTLARARVNAHFTVQTMVRKIEEVYRS